MKIASLLMVLTAALVFSVMPARANIQLPDADQIVANYEAMQELRTFYDEVEAALKTEDIGRIMALYADDYLHQGITKRQLRFMWLEIFNAYDDLYSIHAFSNIHVTGEDAILNCTGALMGIETGQKDFIAVDRWIMLNHWLTRINGKWKMVGGASHTGATLKESKDDSHPLF
jgi:ketosteroid isomerase-like protein